MKSIISKTIEIKCDKFPPSTKFIEDEIKKPGFELIRWAIVEVKNDKLLVSVSISLI